MNSRAVYLKRIGRVLEYIDENLDQELKLEKLAEIAHFSPWHFHRIFHALVGETLAEYVRRRRVETGARLLLSRRWTVSTVALEVGMSSLEVFSRTFRQRFGITPSTWQRGGWRNWAEDQRREISKIHQIDRKKHQAVVERLRHHGVAVFVESTLTGVPFMNVEIKNLPATRVAYLRHVGPYGESGVTLAWQRFAAWCDSLGLMSPRRKMFGIAQDSPDITAPEQCRYDCCVAFDEAVTGNEAIALQTIPGGLYGCGYFSGTSLEIYGAWNRMCSEWLPGSGFESDERPWFEMYLEDFAFDEVTGRFNCLLCLPIRPLTAN